MRLERGRRHSRGNTWRPRLEPLEPRALLSFATPALRPADQAVVTVLAAQLYQPVTTTVPIKVGDQVFPPGTYAVPQPTSSELRRQSFVQRFVGRYTVGPPRFSNQAATIRIFSNGANAASNQFLHARAQVILFTPVDPSAKPTDADPVAGQVIGQVTTLPQNMLSSSNALFMDVTSIAGVSSSDSSVVDHGLPSRLTVTPSPISGGAYAGPQFTSIPSAQVDAVTGQSLALAASTGGAVDFMNGTGLMQVQYKPDRRARAGTLGSGTAIVTIQALINTSGATNVLAQQIN